MNIFSSLKVYAGKWNEVASRMFSTEEKKAVSEAVIVDSEYGNSVMFTLIGGGKTYIPCDVNTQGTVGEVVDLNKARVVTIEKDGEQKFRVRL